MSFQLVSSFRPTGDQPQAIDRLTQSCRSGSPHQTLLGVTGSGKTFTLANVIQNLNLPTLIISHNKTLAAQLYQEFRDFFPGNAVSYFVSYYDYYQPEAYLPATDTYIEKETQINDEIDKLRLSSTAHLLTRPDVIVVASVSCIYNLGSPVEYARNYLELISGQILTLDTLISRLIDMQYTRSDYDLKRGTFRITGDTVTLYPANLSQALRLSFLDNLLQTITPIDPISGELAAGSDPIERTILYPAKHYQSPDAGRDQAIRNIKSDLSLRLKELKASNQLVPAYRLAQRVKHDLEMIRELGYVNGIENYSRYFDGRSPGDPPYTLIDYFHYNAQKFSLPRFLTIIDESHITLPQLKGMYRGDQARKQTLIDFGFRLPSALDNRPLTFAEIGTRLPQILYASATPADYEMGLSRGRIAEQLIRPTGLLDPPITIRPSAGQIPDLIGEILRRQIQGERTLVTTLTKRTAEALTEYLNDPVKISPIIKNSKLTIKNLPKVQYLHADVATLDRQDILDQLRQGDFSVIVGINLLREGLDLPEVALVAILEADKQGFLRSQTSLIQIMGRAARHAHGRVIMYADTVTPSMSQAIAEVKRRRRLQLAYNRQHNQTPQTIIKPIRDRLLPAPTETAGTNSALSEFPQPDSLTPRDRQALVKQYTKKMNQAAKFWHFETAAKYRDHIELLKNFHD